MVAAALVAGTDRYVLVTSTFWKELLGFTVELAEGMLIKEVVGMVLWTSVENGKVRAILVRTKNMTIGGNMLERRFGGYRYSKNWRWIWRTMEEKREYGSWSNFIIRLLPDRTIGVVLGVKRCLWSRQALAKSAIGRKLVL